MATEHFSHQHSLTLDHTLRTCSGCGVQKCSDFYGCNRCHYYICKSCFGLLRQIKHPFHTEHPLTLLENKSYEGRYRCNACGKMVILNGFMYHCSKCSFHLEVNCATLMPCDRTGQQEEEEEQTSHLGHALIACEKQEEGLDFECSVCLLPFKKGTMTIYVCLECRAIMDKSCAELPPEIKHPFHPPHPLLLRSSKDYWGPRKCDACERGSRGFKYWCAACHFEMDTTCVSMRPTVKFELHHHPLVFFNNKQKIIFKDCGVHGDCSGHQLSFPLFRCVPCKFNAFPPAFKHSNHRHSLTLTLSPIRDHLDDNDDSEYYCDVCEDRRLLKQPTYYCHECHYVAHVSCVFKEMLPLAERKLSHQEIILLQKELDALTIKSEKLIEKLDELKERGAQQIGAARDDPAVVEQDEQRIILQAEVDALKTKLETIKFVEFKEGRAQHIGDYQISGPDGTNDASIDVKTFSIVASDHSVIAKPDKEIVIFQAKVDALSAELKSLTIKSDELKVKHMQHVGGNQIGTKASAEDEENDATFSTLTKLDELRKAQTTELEALKKKHDEEMEALITQLETLKKKPDEEIDALTMKLEALKKKYDEEIETLTTKLEALKKKHDEEIEKKRAHHISMSNSNN